MKRLAPQIPETLSAESKHLYDLLNSRTVANGLRESTVPQLTHVLVRYMTADVGGKRQPKRVKSAFGRPLDWLGLPLNMTRTQCSQKQATYDHRCCKRESAARLNEPDLLK